MGARMETCGHCQCANVHLVSGLPAACPRTQCVQPLFGLGIDFLETIIFCFSHFKPHFPSSRTVAVTFIFPCHALPNLRGTERGVGTRAEHTHSPFSHLVGRHSPVLAPGWPAECWLWLGGMPQCWLLIGRHSPCWLLVGRHSPVLAPGWPAVAGVEQTCGESGALPKSTQKALHTVVHRPHSPGAARPA